MRRWVEFQKRRNVALKHSEIKFHLGGGHEDIMLHA
jgi:hypothetical protein